MTSNLSALCTYVKDKIETGQLSLENYISTENMLPNKSGIERAASLPNTNCVQKFSEGDILVSNIRPYFKKIWKAKWDGGCSNDVLVFRASPDCDKDFLYYVLANDSFFSYATATAKGTKMPRGDKDMLMKYQVPVMSREYQRKIGYFFSCIDDEIECNRKINDNLAA